MRPQLDIPRNLPDLQGKIAVITGAGKGIGRCLALSFAKAGAHVVMADIDAEAGAEAMALLQENGCEAVFVKTDVSDEKQVRHLIETAVKLGLGADQAGQKKRKEADQLKTNEADKTGEAEVDNRHLDILINNAAIANAGAAHLFSDSMEAFDKVLSVNLRGPFMLAKLAAPFMSGRQASIVNIASTRAFMSEARTEAYAASKGGLVALTHAMAVSLAPLKIRVNSVSPGWIDTIPWQKDFPDPVNWPEHEHLQHPAGRIGKPADIAAACLWLCSEDAGFITGENLMVDGGMTKKMIYEE